MDDAHVVNLISDSESVETHFFECDFCNEHFYSRADLKKHFLHHNCDDINCSSCHTSTGRKKRITGLNDGRLYEANYSVKSEQTRLIHEEQNSLLLTSSEPGCSFESSTSSSEIDDPRSQEESPRRQLQSQFVGHIFFCIQCNAKFRRKGNLIRHVNYQVCSSVLETQIPSARHFFFCTLCSSKFKRKYNLTRHENSHLTDSAKKHVFFCTECNKRFINKSNLTRHEKSYIMKKPIICPKCNKTFSSKFNLTRHKYLHSVKKRFKCPQCKMKFAHMYYLNVHLASHSNVKKFNCENCDCVYKTKYGLDKHCKKKNHSQK